MVNDQVSMVVVSLTLLFHILVTPPNPTPTHAYPDSYQIAIGAADGQA